MIQTFTRRIAQHQTAVMAMLALSLIVLGTIACNFGEREQADGPMGSRDANQSAPVAAGTTRIESESTDAKALDKGDFKVVTFPLQNQKYAGLEQQVRNRKLLENAADALNKSLALPWDVTIATKDCKGVINAFYQREDHSITVCYEFMELFYNLYVQQGKSEAEANQLMLDATTFIFCHELGHGLIDAYELPATGREEDSVDQLATYISCEEMGPEGEKAAQAGALGFLYLSGNREVDSTAFADEHSMDKQRFYNIACWLYGHNTERYKVIVTDGTLPAERAARCPAEYGKLSAAWKVLLSKYRKQQK